MPVIAVAVAKIRNDALVALLRRIWARFIDLPRRQALITISLITALGALIAFAPVWWGQRAQTFSNFTIRFWFPLLL
ncbi:MAG: hypothetical protein JXA67_14540, partial [Micromonosporaceae bacterium]|nr:hypothetical protein [Micromonosporaceae bacterium]